MSFQHLQLSEPVFGLFLSNAQHRAFLQTAERKHEGSAPRCTGARAHGHTGRVERSSVCFYAKIQQLLLICGWKCFVVKAQVSSLKMISKLMNVFSWYVYWEVLYQIHVFLQYFDEHFGMCHLVGFFLAKWWPFPWLKIAYAWVQANSCQGLFQHLKSASLIWLKKTEIKSNR